MKIRMRKTAIRVCSVAVAAMLLSGVALLDRQSTRNYISSAESAGSTSLIDVSGKYSTQGIRSEYLSGEFVSANASVKNEARWVVVDLGGASLIDAFENTPYAATFPDYANTTAAQNLKAQIERDNEAFLSRLSANGIKYEYKYSYSTLMRGVAIKIKNSDVAAVKAMGEVRDVYASESYLAPTVAVSNDANAYSTGIYNTTGIEQQGQGMVVSVLDTGLDYTHPAFATQPEFPSMTRESVAAEITELESYGRDRSLTIDDFYISEKIPYAYDYADDDADVYPAYSTHGTHVAGIVAGKDDSKIVNTDTNEKFIGVAPEAQLVICKVFTDDLEGKALGGANTIDILAAIADSITLGVDIINMSLGQSVGFSEEGYATAGALSNVYERAEAAGVSLVCAASNDYSSAFGGTFGTNLASNPDSGTVGSPSTFDGALSVAAINGKESKYFAVNGDENKVAFITDSADANGKKYNFLDDIYAAVAKAQGKEVDKSQPLTLNYVLIGGVGRASNYSSATVKNALKNGNTIAVVKRGEISFAEKVQYAKSAGAIACIIYNNVSGNISMSLGEVTNPIPACSVSMDAGKLLVDNAKSSKGTVTFSYEWSAGPFMSEFSSWGPTPDLKLKPEITAHGGEITSSVPGGYAVMSGTSMAAPNMSGATVLLRQYVKATYGLESKALNDRVNQLLMSTATMALGEEGNPYSPRKQGAGLASILSAIKSKAYLTAENNYTHDGKLGYLGENSTKDPKPKIELGDDPNKTGVYEFSFTVNNTSTQPLHYTPEVYVMTESLSTDEKTVAEKAYMLTEHSAITVSVGGKRVTDGVTVPANGTLEIAVKIELDKTAKEYLDKTFENGMFVEGYVRLNAEEGEVSLGIPYLAFYGDWMKAPLFDYSLYEVEESEADKSVDEADKIKATVTASRLYGLYDDEKYIVALGSYLYTFAPSDVKIIASEERAALSCYDYEGKRTLYEIYSLNAGLLRSAKEMEVVITDAETGEVIYKVTEENVRKSFSAGGANRGTNISLKIDPLTWNLSNNKKYTATFTGRLDYDGAGSTERNSYSFSFTIDTEAPRVMETRLRYEPYEENHVTKYRIYLDADVYDNQYAMTLLPCYLDENRLDENGKPQLALLSEFPLPIYSQKGGVTTVTYEVTDCFEEFILKDNFYLAVQDYALNESTVQVKYQDSTKYPASLTLKTDDKLVSAPNQGKDFPTYTLTLDRYEAYTVEAASGLPSGTAITALNFIALDKSVACKANEIFAAEKSGTVLVRDTAGKTLAQINVVVGSNSTATPIMERISLAPMLDGQGYQRQFSGEINLKPNQTRQIQASVEPWYSALIHNPEFEYGSSDESVLTVNEKGELKTLKKGYSYVTVSIKGTVSVAPSMVKVTVDDELDITNNILTHYYGGAICVIPNNKNVLTIDEEAFRNNKLVEEIYLPISVTSIPEDCFKGCENLRKVVFPAECTVIHRGAFKGCEKLEEIVLTEAEDKITNEPYPGTITIGEGAFKGCVSLKTITNQARITTAYDYAFAGCTSLKAIDISGLRTGGDHIFEGCTSLASVTVSSLTHIGRFMFKGCEKLDGITYYSDVIPDYAFAGCTSLASFAYTGATLRYLGEYAFAETAIAGFTLPNGAYTVGAHAFDSCGNLKTLTLSQNTNVSFGAAVFANCGAIGFAGASDGLEAKGGMLIKGTTVVLAPAASGDVTLPAGVSAIGAGAFAGTDITSIDLSGVTEIGAYAFAESKLKKVALDVASVPKGAFQGCADLQEVTFSNAVVEIGEYAFADCNRLWANLSLPAVQRVGDYAFYCAPVEGLTANALEHIGAYAFYGHNFQSSAKDRAVVVLPALTSVGSFAFAKNMSNNYGNAFTSVELGAITEMGEHVFADCPLTTAKFAEGATVIGAFAFVSAKLTAESILIDGVTASNNRLTSVTVPKTVKTVGDYAFLSAKNLRSANINLSGATEIGTGAFWLCSGVSSLDLSNAVTVGANAFQGSGIIAANLEKATTVGAYAFAESKLETLNMPVMQQIGPYAFAVTQLTSVEIPATLPLTYEDKWTEYDDFLEPIYRSGRYFYAFGECSFAAVPALRSITVAEGNQSYFVDEYGVLYGILSGTKEEGTYVLLQYPAGKQMHEYNNVYAVRKNTVRIGDGAFYGATGLSEVRIPETVKEIGSFAFFNTIAYDGNGKFLGGITKYVFEGATAPVLEATFSIPNYDDEQFISAVAYFGIYYSNFYNYAAFPVLGGVDFGLTLVYPERGIGYNDMIWSGFFSTMQPVKSADEKPDDDLKGKGGLSAGAIAGICVGGGAALAGIVAAVVLLVFKRH